METYLDQVGLKFQRRSDRQHTPDDFVKVGSEQPPWFCNERNVYVRFNFKPRVPETPETLLRDIRGNSEDELEGVILEYKFEVCL